MMSVHPSIRPFVDDYELDVEGNFIETCEGYKLTAHCELKQRQSRATRYKGCEPLDQLPPGHLIYPNKPHNNPPQVHYGLGVITQQLYNYATKNRLAPQEELDDPRFLMRTLDRAVEAPDRACGADLYLGYPLQCDYEWTVLRYSNYTWYDDVLMEEDEEFTMQVIQRELNVFESPRWYHDLSDILT